jgi:signal transduction histidine kinase
MFAHAMNSFNYHVRDIPFPDVLWEFLTNVSLGWFGVLLILFVHRHIGIYRKKTEWLFISTGMLATIAALIVPTEKFYNVTQTWISLILLACIYPILLYLVDFYKHRKYTSAIFSVIGTTMIASGVHDMQMQLGLIPHAQHYLPYCFFVLLVLYGGVLIRRFVVAMNDVEELNAHMEGIVQEKKNELEHSYDKLFQLEKEQLLFQERERLTQDMHDGIGGTLVTTLAMAESEPRASRQITDALRHAIADLRLTLISLEPNETLMGSLAMLKSRIGPTFRHGEISLDWNINDIPPLEGEGPTLNLNVMRIIQEATTNIIKHAQATCVEVSSYSEDAFFVISISDNGIGLNPDKVSTQDSSHKGLIHMNKRASKMGGHCRIESTNLGTSIRLFLPINSNEYPSKSISPT